MTAATMNLQELLEKTTDADFLREMIGFTAQRLMDVETAVYNRSDDRLGSVYNFMVNKRSGKVAYAVMSFGGFLGMGASYHPLPWDQLTYDPVQGGYIVNLTREQLEGAPAYSVSRRPHYGMTLLTAGESTITTLRSEGGFSLATSWSKIRPIVAYRDGSRIWMPPVAAGIGFTPAMCSAPNGVVPSGDDVLRAVAIAVCIVAGIIAMVAGSLHHIAGKDPASMRKTILVFGSVLKDGETCDSARVRAETGPAAMLMLHNAMEAREYGNLADGKAPPTPVNSPFGQLEREYRAVYETYRPADGYLRAWRVWQRPIRWL